MSNGYMSLEGRTASLALMGDNLRRLYELAEMYGWREPPGDELNGEQALALADALAEALDDVPNLAAGDRLPPSERAYLNPLERFSGDEKEVARAVGAFARRGGFRVVFSPW
jgi:hypothetical protein